MSRPDRHPRSDARWNRFRPVEPRFRSLRCEHPVCDKRARWWDGGVLVCAEHKRERERQGHAENT